MAPLPQLQSTTLEGAFLEMAFLLQSGEVNLNNKGVAAANFINITADTNNESVNISATIPIYFGATGHGGSIAAAEYMATDYIKFTIS
jgi:hypothetical protein